MIRTTGKRAIRIRFPLIPVTVVAKRIIQYDVGAKRVCISNCRSCCDVLGCSCSMGLRKRRGSARYSRAIGLGRGCGIGVRYLRVVEGYIYGGTDGGEYQKYD